MEKVNFNPVIKIFFCNWFTRSDKRCYLCFY